MRISQSTIIILILMLVFSVLLGNVANLLNTQTVYETSSEEEEINKLNIGAEFDHLIWFLQITDIHISIFSDPTRITQFKEFCDLTVSTIKPSVVLASGDLTDAKTSDSIGSQQFEGEWKHYRTALDESNVLEKTTWLDIRGNHDNFNVAGFHSKQNFFTNYSVQGRAHPRSYMHQTRRGGEIYSFIGVDACLEPGPRRPFNFIGMLDDVEVDELERLIKKSQESGSNYTVWFGHFPTSCIISPGHRSVRQLIAKDKKGLAYVCGHLHRLGGLIPQMYTLQKEGFLELELGDWKDNRVYRLMAIDHGMLSFADIEHGSWPAILITNPKHSLFMVPSKESTEKIRRSTHVRILAFSISDITLVKVRIDKEAWRFCNSVKTPLYVCAWNPARYSSGVHHIEVYVEDSYGRQKIATQPFSLDDSRLSFSILSRLALMSDASTNFKIMFGTMIALTIVPLCTFRYMHKLVKANKLEKPSGRGSCLKLWMRKLWILSSVDFMFWPIILYPVYLTFGPWTVGYLVEDHIGVIFAWGILVNGTFLPGSFTYAYGFFQLFTFHFPLILILAHGVDVMFHHRIFTSGKPKPLLTHIGLYLPFSLILAIQLLMAYFFWLAYGGLAFVLGFLRTWSIILAIVLWHYTMHLPDKCIREISSVWGTATQQLQTDASL